ncbi:Uncharacterised protein [uncultured archaeon]|nr:Uncharacterised protein [uncultured archaeon]
MNKNVYAVVIAVIVLSIFVGSAGAVPQELWIKTFGGDGDYRAGSVQQTSDSGYIIAGGIFGANKNNAFLIKTDENGTELWNSTLDGTGFVFVRQTSDGGYVLAGKKSIGTGSVVWIARTDAYGSYQWSRTFGENGDNEASSVRQTPDGGYILAGFKSTNGIEGQSGDGWLIKTDENGLELWNRTFGGEGIDGFNSIYLIRDGGYIISGVSSSYETKNVGFIAPKAWLVKTDENGSEKWNKTFDAEGSASFVQETSDGGYVLTGSSPVCLIKTDKDGNEQWKKTLGEGSDSANAVQQTMDGGYILAGTTFEPDVQAWLIKTDTNGNKEWKWDFGRKDIDEAHAVWQTKDGGYIVAGTTNWRGPKSDAWLIKVVDTSSLALAGITTLFDLNYCNPGWIVTIVIVILGAVIGLSLYSQNKRIYFTIILTVISLITILLISQNVISVGNSSYPPAVTISVVAAIMVFIFITTYMKRYYPYSVIFASLSLMLLYDSSIQYIVNLNSSIILSFTIGMLPNLAVIPIAILAASRHNEKLGFAYPIALSAVLGIISGINLPPSHYELWFGQAITFLVTVVVLVISGILTILRIATKFIKSDPENSYIQSLKVTLSLAVLFVMLTITYVYMYLLPDYLHLVRIL